MTWNKEFVVFLLCLVIFAGSLYVGVATLGGVSTDKPEFPILNTGDVVHIGNGPDEWEWFRFDDRTGPREDPFATISQWSGANPDPMPLPPREPLARRIPLPGILAASLVARPALEEEPPAPEEENDE